MDEPLNRKKLNPDSSPEAAFGALLREEREKQGLTQEALAFRTNFSSSHISAVETARKKPTLPLARSVDVALGTGDMFERKWRKMNRAGLLEGFPQFLVDEAKAVEIRLFEVSVIPGLLQTPEYASVIAQSEVRRGAITSTQADERIALVADRQATLKRTPAPLVVAVLDEAVLHRPLGGPEVMNAQLDKLIEFAELPNTHLQIAPFALGERRPFDLPITFLTMPDRALVSFAESALRGHLERDKTFVVPALTAYHQLQAESFSQADSVAMIRKFRRGTP
ncbi:helix-turn-helix domain-containing protein [Streptomyces acidiscabies]|uniref:helix-turn-helix domain-containing protein n=1 Tax=Streptomyces acidiscabies TaxID=42234 RepID=UPI000289368E|nr:helix-turn-helix protein [Streptomyces acidiscabies]GAV42557.1 helix-turn-helix protein [Streptomyces acidiscabies]